MTFGEIVRSKLNFISGLALALLLALLPNPALAQDAAASTAPAAAASAPAATASTAATPATGAAAYTPLGPDMIKGQPTDPHKDFWAGSWFQTPHSQVGRNALWMHDVVLVPVITVITLLVLALLLIVVARFNRRVNPVPSKTSHNTMLEIAWTALPILILVAIFVPSLNLLLEQYQAPPKDAITVKATGNQWFWTYSYPDNGGFEVVSNMLPDDQAIAKGLPPQLAVDHRMVVPAGVPIRLQTTGADVIHSFAVPSLWFKLDAVPGRINERLLQIDEPGIYYGQCSELCGARHGYMPIAVEAVPMAQYNAWVLSQGGTIAGAKPAAAPAPAAGPAPLPAPVPPASAT
jgi:cytochrome c oxidase subunit 2